MMRSRCPPPHHHHLLQKRRSSGRLFTIVVLLLLLVLLLPRPTRAVQPSLILQQVADDNDETTTTTATTTTTPPPQWLLSQALFGRLPSMDQTKEPILTIQYADSLLCDDNDDEGEGGKSYHDQPPTLLMVPRGICTFQTKAAMAQRQGAAAMIVYGTLASRYSVNSTSHNHPTIDDIIFPLDKYDYDCDRGEGMVPYENLVFDNPIPYNADINDAVLRNSCGNCEFCLVTGLPDKTTTNDATTTAHVKSCCAWDLRIYLYADTATNATTTPTPIITIPAAYMTMAQVQQVQAGLQVKLYQRWRPSWNISSMLIWLLGVVVAGLAGHCSAEPYHRQTKKLMARRERRRRQQQRENGSRTTRRPPATTMTSPPPRAPPLVQPEDVMELTAAHAAGFLVMSSTSLLVLFYFKIYGFVKILYAFGCSTAVAQVILYPLSYYCFMKQQQRPGPDRQQQHQQQRAAPSGIDVRMFSHDEIGDVTLRDLLCHAVAIALGATWLLLSFLHPDPDRVLFYWMMQDVFGACMCITFLQVIRLNNIRVATILLVVAFFYDIFFVFVTPYLFHGKSVMITVATSGGPPKADELWCEKYPSHADCQGGNPLPMLLAIPRLFCYTGGSSLLGLGDIVLPGLLLSFAARMDAAKTLIGVSTGGQAPTVVEAAGGSLCPPTEQHRRRRGSGCYFWPLVVAYAIGLAMANAAVYYMRMGQPALLYLVPCCLGTMLYVGRNELSQLWDGPRVLKAADEILYGPSSSSSSADAANNNGGGTASHAPLPVEEEAGDGAIAPPSAVDDDEDDDNSNVVRDAK